MPVDPDTVRNRISDIRASILELKRITSKPYNELNIDEVYSMRYNIIVIAESLAPLSIHIAVEEYNHTPRSYADA